MIRGVIELLQDASASGRAFAEAQLLRRSGAGTDYLSVDHGARLRRAVEAIHPSRMTLKVREIVQETPTTKTFRMARSDGPPPPWRGGQYVSLFVDIGPVRTNRAYSLSCAPGGETLDLTVRDKPDGFVAPWLLKNVRVGDVLRSSGPLGSFYYEPLADAERLVFLAGGSGITPFMGMLRDFSRRGWPIDVTLLYGSRITRDVIFGKELKALAKQSERFTYAPVISEPTKSYRGRTGFLTAELIRDVLGEVGGRSYYVCGPGAMYDFVLPVLGELGVPRHRVKRELYGPPANVSRSPGWPGEVREDATFLAEVVHRGRVDEISVVAGEPLLCSLERGGIVVETACRSGECSACRTKILEGKVYQPPHVGLRESDRAHGYVHACVSYPLTNLRVRL